MNKNPAFGHWGLMKWVRWAEQQAKVQLPSSQTGILVFIMKEMTCVWFGDQA